MALACWPSFLGGALLLLALEVILGVALLSRLMQSLRQGSREARAAAVSSVSEAALAKREVDQPPSPRPSSSGSVVLQGVVWVASEPRDHGRKPRDKQKRRESWKDVAEVNPVWRRGKLQDRTLILTASDGVEDTVLLEGCTVVAVSGGVQPGRKWARRYPVKLSHNRRLVYGGSSTCLLYFNTGWEKEAWCECLRGAAKLEYDADDWYVKLKKEFEDYSVKVSNQQPFYSEAVASQKRITGGEAESGSKKRRFFWKRLTKKNSKTNKELKAVFDGQSSSGSASRPIPDGEEKPRGRRISYGSSTATISERTVSLSTAREGLAVAGEIGKSASMPSLRGESVEVVEVSGPQKSVEEGQVLSEGRNSLDHGLLCWNMIISRMFFDIYHSADVTGFVQQRIQKLLTAKSTNPGYIGAIICTHLDLGTCPPLAHGMRVLPVDSDGVWALEADLEYYGGAVLTVETRLDLRDPRDQERVANQGLEPSLAGAATAELLTKGLASLGEDLEIAGRVGAETSSISDRKGLDASKVGSSRRSWVQSSIASCKSMLKNVAEQVSQVPLTLSVKVVSLKGTLCLRFRPPPSDRVWFGFTAMPSLEMESEPCIGDHKISSGPIAAFIVERIKVLLREALVLPQCEDIHLPWMITDNNNWVPQNAAPFSWSGPVQNGESSTNVVNLDSVNLPVQSHDKVSEDSVPAPPVSDWVALQSSASTPPQSQSEMDNAAMVVPIVTPAALGSYDAELKVPLLGNEAGNANGDQDQLETVDASISLGEQYSDGEASSRSLGPGDGAEQTSGKAGPSRRTRVLNLGKRLGVKFEDKRKHVLERIRERKASGGVSEFSVEELTDGRLS